MVLDKPMAAAAIGALCTLPYEILTRAAVFSGIGKYSIYQLDSLVITLNRPDTILGLVVSCVVSSFSAVLLYLVFEKIGRDYMVIKNTMASLLVWTTLEFTFMSIIESRFIEPRPVSDYYSHLLGAIVFGISQGLLFKRYLFKKQSHRV